MLSRKNQIPKSLDACLDTNYEAITLRGWAEKIEQWGSIIFFVLCVVGFVASIVAGNTSTYAIFEEFSSGSSSSFDWLQFLTSLVTWAIYILIEYCVYNVLVLLINSLASIIENTKITANVALYKAQLEERKAKSDNTSTKESTSDTDGTTTKSNKSLVVKDGTITCPMCGKEQNADRTRCYECGTQFSW